LVFVANIREDLCEVRVPKKATVPWYESNLFRSPANLSVTLVLTLLATTRHDLSWLLWLAAGFLLVSIWTAVKQLKHPGPAGLLLLACILIVCGGAYWMRDWFLPVNAAQTAQSQSQPAQSNTTAGDKNNSGNISQTGGGNNAVVGNNNKVGNISVNPGPHLSGWLVPASEPLPKLNDCGKPKENGLALYMGNSVYLVDKFPATVVRVGGVPRLTLEKGAKGIAITTDIFDDSEPKPKIIASIERNQFTINPNNYFKLDWSNDRSQLRVVDQYKDEVLNIHYLNKNAISLVAVLHYPGVSGPITISAEGISWEHIRIHGGADCYPTSGGADLDINAP
jgi:hypothetical protein